MHIFYYSQPHPLPMFYLEHICFNLLILCHKINIRSLIIKKLVRDRMNPCKACLKQYNGFLCNNLGHCIFEDSGEWPKIEACELIKEKIVQTS